MGLWTRTEGRGRDIVFVHGWGMSHHDEVRVYEPVFADRPGWCRHYVDLPGMGHTPASPAIRDLDGMLDALQAQVEALTEGRPFLLAGTSLGAYLARGLLRRLPARVDGLLLRVPLIVPDDADRDIDAVRPLIERPAVMDALPRADRDALGELLVQTPAYVEAALARITEGVAPADALADRAALDAIRQSREHYRLSDDPDAGAAPFERPALIVTGRHDAVVGYRDAWRLAQTMPRCTFATLDRAGHDLPVDQGHLFGALVRDWLARVEEMGRPAEGARLQP